MFVYILHSPTADTFYIGFTSGSVEERLRKHLQAYYEKKYTARHHDWKVFLSIACKSDTQARAIEKHIKKMKSKTYIKNLKSYPEITEKLLLKYHNS